MKVKCCTCNKDLDRSTSDVTRNKSKLFFCSFDCKSKHYRQRYQVKCVVCGLEFEKSTSEQKRYPNHCCSVKCRNKYNDKRSEFNCMNCGDVVLRPPSLSDRKVFCSEKCHNVYQDQRQPVICSQCGEQFFKQKCLISRSRYDFCNSHCRSAFVFHDNFVENEFEELLKPLQIHYERYNRTILADPSDARKCPELDFYFPTIKFAVEINGSCHYKPVYGEEALAAQKVRDRNKRKRCRELGIILRVVRPGNCKTETYLPRYKKVICEIKGLMRTLL